jgi:threonine/homoserine/homoserine lactone efflux protein
MANRKLSRIFYQGVLVNVLNPKTALFFFAFLPQFVDASRGVVAGQIMFLGFIFVILGVCSDGSYALLAGTLGHWLRGNLRFLRAQRYFAGSMYIGLGLTAALSGSGRK